MSEFGDLPSFPPPLPPPLPPPPPCSPGSKKKKLARSEPVSFSQRKHLVKDNDLELMAMLNGWKKLLQNTEDTQQSTEEVVKKGVGIIQKARSEATT